MNAQYRTTFLKLFALLAVYPAGSCAFAEDAPAPDSKVTQVLVPRKVETFSSTEIAQLSAPKNPALASDISTEPLSLDSVPVTTMTTDSLAEDLSTASLSLAEVGTTSALNDSNVYLQDSLRGSSISSRDSLLSLPPIGYDSTSTTLDIDSLLSRDAALSTGPSAIGLSALETTGAISLTDIYKDPRAGDFQKEFDALINSKNVKKLSLLQAVCQSLASNQSLKVERLRPEISNTSIENAEGAFDTVVQGSVGYGSNHRSTLGARPRSGPDKRNDDIAVSRNFNYDVGVGGRLPSGTDYSLNFSGSRSSSNSTRPFFANDVNLNITQNLLKGAGSDVNLISVWTAQNNFVISLYQLQSTLIDLVTDVQKGYWDVYLAYETLDIRRKAYQVAREQRERTEEFVRVGRSAPLDALAAQAEEASRISDMINAVANLKQRQLTLLRLINPENMSTGWRSLVFPSEQPILPTEKLVPEERIKLARYYRPDLRQAQIDLANGDLEVYRTANGLLPQLDFILSAGLSGVGDSQGDSLDSTARYNHRNYQVGLQFSYPLQNRQANAAHRRANFQKALATEAVANFCQIIDVDVRTAILEIERTSRLIYSTQITEELRRRQLEAETEKFRVGRSTQIEVSQAQRDYVQSQLDRVSAQVANINAYLELYRVEGTALQRRGIQPIHITPESGVPAG